MLLPLKESIWGIRGLIAVLFLFLLFIAWSTNLLGVQDWFFNMLGGGTIFEPTEDIQAMQSVEALVCAINSVAKGSPYTGDGCSKYFTSGTLSHAPYTGYIFGDIGRGKILCHRVEYYYYCSTFCYFGDEKVEEFDTEEECEEQKRELTTAGYMGEEGGANVSCLNTREGYECRVTDFNLPQDVSGFKEWIPYHGDPYYMVYWQNFPQEEDTWNFRISWSTYAIMAGISLVPWGKVAGFAGKKILTKGLQVASRLGIKRGIQWSAKKFMNTLVRVKFWNFLSRRGLGKTGAVKRFMRRSLSSITQRKAGALKVGKEVVKNSDEYVRMKNFINRISSEQVDRAFDATSREMADVGVELADPGAYLREYSEKLVNNVFEEAGRPVSSLTGLDRIVKQEMIKDINEKLLHVAVREALKESWTERILNKNTLQRLPSYTLRSGAKFAALYGAARAAEIADSIISAREDEIPNTIALKKPLSSPYEFRLSDKMSGNPVFVNLMNIKDYWVLPQLWDEQKHFYLASPCHLKSMEVKGVFASCGNFEHERVFEYDSETGLKKGETEMKSCEGEIAIEYSLKQPECDIEKYKIGTPGLSAVDKEFVNWMQGLTETPGEMGFIYNETSDCYTIPVAKDVYFYFYPDNPEKGKMESNHTEEGQEWALTRKEIVKDAVKLHENRQEALEQISLAILECFDNMEGGFEGTCAVFETSSHSGNPITEKDVTEWMCGDDEECKKGNLKDENQREKAIDLIGYGIINQDNMDWDIEYIGAGDPLYVGIHTDRTLINEVHIGSLDNVESLSLKEKDGDGKTILEHNIEIKKHGMGITDIKITIEDIVIEVSDMGDNGMLRSISISKGEDAAKAMIDMDFAEDGFERFNLKNCHTSAVLITEMEKTSESEHDPNYCTRGETAGGAWLEWAGDVSGIVAIGVACSVGAVMSAGSTCLGAIGIIMVSWGVTEVATEAITQVGGWPTQTW